MSTIVLSLSYLVSLIVFLTVLYLLFNRFLKNCTQQKNPEMEREALRIMLPLKIQAYERMMLFLERIFPRNLIIRELNPGLPVNEYHLNLVKTIREEFDHNLAQQLYISVETWELIKSAKEEIIQLIHKASMEMASISDSSVLAGVIIETATSLKMDSWHTAARKLKEEFARLG